MSIKSLSKAASALALVGVVAPFLAQSVGAAEEPTSALSGVAGVTDPSGSQIINSAAASDAKGKSFAGIGFVKGDLILYQVPNFDFSMNNKIAADTYKMISTPNDKTSNRMAVIVDNRYTQVGAEADSVGAKFNWQLSAKAGSFNASNVSSLDDTDVNLLINDKLPNNKSSLTYNRPQSQYKKGDATAKVYEPGTDLDGLPSGLTLAENGSDIMAENAKIIATERDSSLPGPAAINFKNPSSAEFVVLAGNESSGISKIVPSVSYVSDIDWTLGANPVI